MTAASYTDEGTLAEYYWYLSTHFFVQTKQTIPTLNRWIETRQIILIDDNSQITFDPEQPYDLRPIPFARLLIQTKDGPRDAADYRVLIPAAEPMSTIKTYPPPLKPPRFAKSRDPLPEPVAEPVSTVSAWAEGLNGPNEIEASAFLASLLAMDPKTGKKAHEAKCVKQFKISPNAYEKRVWPTAHLIADLPMRKRKGP